MKRILSLLLLLGLSALGFGQGVVVAPQTALKSINGVTMPIAGATITVCAQLTSGIPCTPVLTNAVFRDAGLSQPLSNPFFADSNGNYQFAIAPGTYTVTVTAAGFSGYSYQVTAGASGSSASNGTLTNCTAAGTSLNKGVQFSTQTVNGVLQICGTIAGASSQTVIGLCLSNCGNSSAATLSPAPVYAPCIFDNQTGQNDYAVPSSTPGECHDVGANKPAGTVEILGIIASTNSGPGQIATIDVAPLSLYAPGTSSGSGNVNAGTTGQLGYYASTGNAISGDACTTDGNGHLQCNTIGTNTVSVNGSGAGAWTVQLGTGLSSPASGFGTYYIDSGTNQFTCILHSGASCLNSSSAFSAITSGANTSANMQVSTGAVLQPLNIGQVAGSQAWLAPGLVIPAASCINSGGSIGSAHGWLIQYTLNTGAGESLPSIELSTSAGSLGCASNSSQIVITAPTLPSGYSSYNIYACDTSSGLGCTVPQKVAACTAITSNCTFTAPYGTNTTSVPTISTAFTQPPNVQAFNGQYGEVPSLFFPKADGNYYPWAAVEWASCDATTGPPLPCGTPVFTHRTYFNDAPNNNLTYGTPIAYKNSQIAMNHRFGLGTTLTNQDRGLAVFTENYPANDTSTYRGWFGIQQELDVNGAPTVTGGTDANIIGAQFQISNNSTATVSASNTWVVSGSFFNNSTSANGYVGGGGTRVVDFNGAMTNNNTNNAPSGTEWDVYNALWGVGTGTGTNLQGFGYRCNMPTTSIKFGSFNACFYVPNVALTLGNNDMALNNEWQTSPGIFWGFAGPVQLDSISHDQVGTMNINASTNVVGSVSASQISFTGAGITGGCSGGASTYTYQLVFVDANGGQSPASSPTASINNCTNPLTAGNPVTLSPSGLGLQRNDGNSTAHAFQQAQRIDVYRVSGPMATGKIGSLTCKFNINIYGCSNFVDSGLSASGSLPAVNTTGGISSAGDITFTTGKGQHFNTQAAANDFAGTVGVAASTTASVTFTRNYTATPVCVLTPQTTGLTSWFLSAISTSGFTVTVAPSGTYTFGYICVGNPN